MKILALVLAALSLCACGGSPSVAESQEPTGGGPGPVALSIPPVGTAFLLGGAVDCNQIASDATQDVLSVDASYQWPDVNPVNGHAPVNLVQVVAVSAGSSLALGYYGQWAAPVNCWALITWP